MLFMQSMRMYYIVEAINIQIFPQDSLQTIDSEHKCKITSYEHINQSKDKEGMHYDHVQKRVQNLN